MTQSCPCGRIVDTDALTGMASAACSVRRDWRSSNDHHLGARHVAASPRSHAAASGVRVPSWVDSREFGALSSREFAPAHSRCEGQHAAVSTGIVRSVASVAPLAVYNRMNRAATLRRIRSYSLPAECVGRRSAPLGAICPTISTSGPTQVSAMPASPASLRTASGTKARANPSFAASLRRAVA